METAEWIALISGIVAVVVVVAAWYRSGTVPTVQGVTNLANELQEVARVAVSASEQLKQNGTILSNDDAFQHAVDHVDRWLEVAWPNQKKDLDPRVVANAVEAAYHWLKLAQKALPQRPSTESEIVDKWLKQQPPSDPF